MLRKTLLYVSTQAPEVLDRKVLMDWKYARYDWRLVLPAFGLKFWPGSTYFADDVLRVRQVYYRYRASRVGILVKCY